MRSSPVLIGKLWYSDAGDRHNAKGAFLGDQRWAAGDRAGNAILVAVNASEKGSVTVFGDTSPFINRNIPHNAEFIRSLFGQLNGQSLNNLSAEMADTGRTFISLEEGNAFSRDGFSPYSVTALAVAAMRCGQPAVVGDWDAAGPADTVFILNPTKKIRQDRILSAVCAGTTVVVTGAGDNPHFQSFAMRLGYRLGDVPLGAIDGESMKTYSAWELNRGSVSCRRITVHNHTVGAVQRLGQGRLIVLADNGFFYSKNLEEADRAEQEKCGVHYLHLSPVTTA